MSENLEENQYQNDFAAHFYEEVNNVIGGTNPNEKLCLLLPGIALTKSDYEYDYKNNSPKGPVIEANESRLANKLYDPFDMVGGDNGKTLERQYRSAINMLVPKLNAVVAQTKNLLREFILKPFPYKFGAKNILRAEIRTQDGWKSAPADVEDPSTIDSETKEYTFQEVFFRLYNNYVEQMSEWADERQRRKEYYREQAEIKLAGAEIASINKKAENDYLQWYEDNAEKWLTATNQKLSVLLSVFSDNDMKIIEGILDSGSGAELQEARQTLNNTRKINPDGGYIYPVKFNPTNWFEYLDTSFTPVDLVDSPSAIFDELKLCYTRRDFINSRIAEIAPKIPTTDDIERAKKDAEEARATFNKCDDDLQDAMESSFGDFAKFVAVAICTACCPPAGIAAGVAVGATEAAKEIINGTKTIAKVAENNTTLSKVVEKTKDKLTKAISIQSESKDSENKSTAASLLETIKKAAISQTSIGTLVGTAQNALTNLQQKAEGATKEKLTTALQNLITSSNISSIISDAKNNLSALTGDAKDAKEKVINDLKTAEAALNELENVKEAIDNTPDASEAKEILTSNSSIPEELSKLKEDLTSNNSNLGETISKGIDIVFEGSGKVSLAQSNYLTSMSAYTEALLKASNTDALKNYHLQLENLNIDKAAIDSKIKLLEEKLSRVDNFEQCFSDSVNPPSVPDGFTQFNIVHNTTETESSNKEKSKISISNKTKGFWIFKSKKRSVETKSSIESMCSSKGTEIQIGMNVAKVGIEREWFNPGIFTMTGEMYNVADRTGNAENEYERVLRISHGAETDDYARLSKDVFPCYPTAMVIARDVTIKLTTTLSKEESEMRSASKEVSNSKAFFVYNAGDGSRSHTSFGQSKSKSNGRSITIRFTTPQVIGYYLQIVPRDESVPYPAKEKLDESTVIKFIEVYEQVVKGRIDELNSKDSTEESKIIES